VRLCTTRRAWPSLPLPDWASADRSPAPQAPVSDPALSTHPCPPCLQWTPPTCHYASLRSLVGKQKSPEPSPGRTSVSLQSLGIDRLLRADPVSLSRLLLYGVPWHGSAGVVGASTTVDTGNGAWYRARGRRCCALPDLGALPMRLISALVSFALPDATYLQPLLYQPALLDGLRCYFDTDTYTFPPCHDFSR